MNPCEGFQQAIERRRRGDLSAGEARVLATHLEGCPSCHRYEALVESTEGHMSEALEGALREMDWDRVQARVAMMGRQYRQAMAFVALALALIVAVRVWYEGSDVLPATLALGAGVLVIYAVVARSRVRELGRACEARGEVLASYRRELDRRLGSARRAVCIEALVGGGLLARVVLGLLGLMEPFRSSGAAALSAAAGVLLLAVAVWRGLSQLPRLRGERADLG
ncbi:MAG: zf-HC2 domain-containing protein [Planctomycetes bacterium]|nr:zf-HC2 domain-containing protein [Planctomycetota bacterium]